MARRTVYMLLLAVWGGAHGSMGAWNLCDGDCDEVFWRGRLGRCAFHRCGLFDTDGKRDLRRCGELDGSVCSE